MNYFAMKKKYKGQFISMCLHIFCCYLQVLTLTSHINFIGHNLIHVNKTIFETNYTK